MHKEHAHLHLLLSEGDERWYIDTLMTFDLQKMKKGLINALK